MNKINLFLTLVLILLLTTSCATVQTAKNIVPKNDRIFNHSYQKVYSQSINTLMELKWQISHSDKNEGLIQAKTPMNLWTWGDLVTVYIIKQEDNKVFVNITSASPQQHDWGKNGDNIEKFYSALRSNLNM